MIGDTGPPSPGTPDVDEETLWEDLEEDVQPAVELDAPMQDELNILYEEQLPTARMKDLKTAQEFVRMVQEATLNEDMIDADVLARLRNPPKEVPDISDPAFRFSLDVYLALEHASQESYGLIKEAAARINIDMLSFSQVKRRAAEITGITPVYQDMCVNTCVAYTGPFRTLTKCPVCAEQRYEMRCTASDTETLCHSPADRSPPSIMFVRASGTLLEVQSSDERE